jgi:hypothetical protein
MKKNNQTTDELLAQVSANALKNAVMGLSLAQALKEELADFISQSTNETKEEIIRRIDSREKEIRQRLVKSVVEQTGLSSDSNSHEQQNGDSSI